MYQNMIGRPMEILLIEDNFADARLTIEALRDGHVKHRMTVLVDGIDAMQFLRHEGKYTRAPRPDLILLDLYLPRKDGREVLKEIKADYEMRNIPVVIMTASRAHETAVQEELLEGDSYITKPVDLEKFIQVVRELKHDWFRADVILPGV